jgi:hypothetical protein
MSSSLRIALVCEGPTDKIAIENWIAAELGHENFSTTLLQPQTSAIAGDFGPNGGGWYGVLRWCEQATGEDLSFSNSLTVLNYDLIIFHLDADVAREEYLSPLKLECPCPNASDTCDNLRSLLSGYLGGELPSKVVFWVPSDSTEAWIIAALAPEVAQSNDPWECFQKPENLLTKVLIHKKGVGKSARSYRRVEWQIRQGWPSVKEHCLEAERFATELKHAIVSSVTAASPIST